MSHIYFQGTTELNHCRIYTYPSNAEVEDPAIQKLYKKITKLKHKVKKLKKSCNELRTQLPFPANISTDISTIDDILDIQAVIDAHSSEEAGEVAGNEQKVNEPEEAWVNAILHDTNEDEVVIEPKKEVVEKDDNKEENANKEEAEEEEVAETEDAESEEEAEEEVADAEEEVADAEEAEEEEVEAEEEEVEAEEEVVEAEEEVAEAEEEEEDVEVVEAGEEVAEAEEEEEGEEVEEYIIHGTRYYVSDKVNGIIYNITPDDEIGEMIGTIVKGKPYFK